MISFPRVEKFVEIQGGAIFLSTQKVSGYFYLINLFQRIKRGFGLEFLGKFCGPHRKYLFPIRCLYKNAIFARKIPIIF